MSQRIFKHVVELPRDRKMKDIRRWLLDNIGPPGGRWSINVDMEVVEFFSNKVDPRVSSSSRRDSSSSRLTEIFNIGFKSEEDKVKFILSFL